MVAIVGYKVTPIKYRARIFTLEKGHKRAQESTGEHRRVQESAGPGAQLKISRYYYNSLETMSGLNTAQAAGVAGTGGPFSIDVSAKSTGTPGPEASDNRFETELSDIQKTAAFGVNIGKVIAAKSGGRKDYTKQIQFSIRSEYFTMRQFVVGMFWSIILGIFVGTLVMSLIIPGASWDVMAYPAMTIGVFVLAMGVADVMAETQAFSTQRHCTSEKHKSPKTGEQEYIVDPEYHGTPCFDPMDCTKASRLEPGQENACKASRWGISKLKRRYLTPVVLLAGIVLVSISFTDSDERPSVKNLYLSSVFGMFTGTALAVIFP